MIATKNVEYAEEKGLLVNGDAKEEIQVQLHLSIKAHIGVSDVAGRKQQI